MQVSLALLLFGVAEAANGGKTTIAIGNSHACAIAKDNTVKCWGHQCHQGACDPADGEYKAVSVGNAMRRRTAGHSCGIGIEDGSVTCWGSHESVESDYSGVGGHRGSQPASPVPPGEFTQITSGKAHTCGLRPNGKVECWGPNADTLNGQYKRLRCHLKNYAYPHAHSFLHSRPMEHPACDPAPFGEEGCAVHCSGEGSTPRWEMCSQCNGFVPEGTYKAVSAGDEFTCGLKTDGSIVCWGRVEDNVDWNGSRCKNGQPTTWVDWNKYGPVNVMCERYGNALVPNPHGTWDSLTSGPTHMCAEKDGDYTCWGEFHHWGRMDPVIEFDTNDFDPFIKNTFRSGSMSLGVNSQCGITTDGDLKCSGCYSPMYNDPATLKYATDPTLLATIQATDEAWLYGGIEYTNPKLDGKKFASVGVGQTYGCGITDDGEIVCFGYNIAGWQCGNNNVLHVAAPFPASECGDDDADADAEVMLFQGNGPTPAPTPPGDCLTSVHVDLGDCAPDQNGWANVDMDVAGVGTGDMTLTYGTKEEHEASDRTIHGATVGSFTYQTANGRYFLPCKQAEGEKTIKVTVSRPAAMTEFGGEWIQAFPKDSWANVTNEYEPYTFNDYGSKIPLQELRPTTVDAANRTIVVDAKNKPTMTVYMEMKTNGDYEMRYGNPQLVTTNDKWIAIEFKKSQLRVGSPWADCTDSGDDVAAATYSTVGTIIPAYLGNPALDNYAFTTFASTLHSALTGSSLPVKVILSIHTPSGDAWTESSAAYGKCYKAGEACPEHHTVCDATYCEIERWNQIIAKLKEVTNVQVLGLVETKDAEGKPRPDGDIQADIAAYVAKTPVDGYYFNEAHGSKKTVDALMGIVAGLPGRVPGSPFTVFGHGEPLFDAGAVSETQAAGEPDVWITLNDAAANTGVWTPFSWYSSIASSRWGAVVYDVDTATVEPTLTTILDRGYGYVYLHDTDLFNTTSSDLTTLVTELGDKLTGNRRLEDEERRLQTQDTGLATTSWMCDDTLFECKPVCVETIGVTSSKVADRKCSAAAPEKCCRCYHDAEWQCEDNAVVCKAKIAGGEEETVGDLVCESRGAPKPDWNPAKRQAGACEPLPTPRGQRPSPECLRNAGAPTGKEFGADVDMTSLDMVELLAGSLPAAAALAVAVLVA